MDNSVRNLIVASIVLILVSIYGGDTLGSWFVMKTEAKDGDLEYEGVDKYHLTGATSELEWSGSDAPDNVDVSTDYDDNDCSLGKCKEMSSLMIAKVKYLLYLSLISGFAALYFLNENDVEKGKMACLVMGGAGLLAAIMFALFFPEALDDDVEIWDSLESMGIESEPSLFGSETETEEGITFDVAWRPDFAFFLVAISGILGIAAREGIDDEASSNLSQQNEYQDNPFGTTSLPSIPTLEGTPTTPNPYQVQCGNCQMMMDGNAKHCPHCGFQNR